MANFTALEWITIVALFVFFFLVLVYVTRAIFSISKQLRYQEAAIELLIKIAQKHGVSEDEISGIRNNMKPQPIM